jgi:hypothetical protein
MDKTPETQQKREARWAAYRASRDTQLQSFRSARAQARGKIWFAIGVVLLLLALLAMIVLFIA